MLEVEKDEIRAVQKYLLKELEKIHELDNPGEALQRIDVLWNINRYLENYEELKPTMQKFFIKKARKEKYGRDER